jgi:hypothetical protein
LFTNRDLAHPERLLKLNYSENLEITKDEGIYSEQEEYASFLNFLYISVDRMDSMIK